MTPIIVRAEVLPAGDVSLLADPRLDTMVVTLGDTDGAVTREPAVLFRWTRGAPPFTPDEFLGRTAEAAGAHALDQY
jgi:hypothetical protein